MYKLVFLNSLFMGTLISISSYSWMGMWMGLEINLLSIIPLMKSKSMSSSESSIKYFITQAIASTVILISILLMMSNLINTATLMIELSPQMTLNSALLTKMGAAPFHFWFPEIIEGLSWMNCMLMFTWQKIAPMIILMYGGPSINLIFSSILASMIISGVMSMNQVSLRKILTYSSINHMGWMLMSMILNKTIWLVYFTIYCIMTINIILTMNFFKIFFLQQMFQIMNQNSEIKFLFSMNFLSLAGIPPMIGFFPKWLTIQLLIQQNQFIMAVIMIILTLFMIFVYMRMAMSTLVMNSSESSWNQMFKLTKIKSFLISVINFSNLFSLILMTILFNL
uniref:NADH-ubiquinone oxidoreductase chain 2 n=1 Tax=Elateroidea sp. 9 KM-2017 TaxID=2219432 RepID=A0A346RJ34_9COLE|nr:NADH dehydrogenase subunit 2 [Elateroidea sp. 9 KM-2017]